MNKETLKRTVAGANLLSYLQQTQTETCPFVKWMFYTWESYVSDAMTARNKYLQPT